MSGLACKNLIFCPSLQNPIRVQTLNIAPPSKLKTQGVLITSRHTLWIIAVALYKQPLSTKKHGLRVFWETNCKNYSRKHF